MYLFWLEVSFYLGGTSIRLGDGGQAEEPD